MISVKIRVTLLFVYHHAITPFHQNCKLLHYRSSGCQRFASCVVCCAHLNFDTVDAIRNIYQSSRCQGFASCFVCLFYLQRQNCSTWKFKYMQHHNKIPISSSLLLELVHIRNPFFFRCHRPRSIHFPIHSTASMEMS